MTDVNFRGPEERREDGVLGDRCSGHCCRAFTLPMGPNELRSMYETWLRGDSNVPRLQMSAAARLDPRRGVDPDIHLIYPMVRYLGHFDVPPVRAVNPVDSGGGHFYTCKHYDRKTGDCTIYDVRPRMCREYPYAHKCNYASCTWTSQKATKLPKARKSLPVVKDEYAKAMAPVVGGEG